MLFAWPLSGWGYALAPFQLGIWSGPFLVGDMDQPLSGWGYGPAPFRLGIWVGPFLVGDVDRPFLVAHFSTRWQTANWWHMENGRTNGEVSSNWWSNFETQGCSHDKGKYAQTRG